jgi:hypothetical protein
MVTVPNGFRTQRFFELAKASGAVLTELRADEENLERLFFRVTAQASSANTTSDSTNAESPAPAAS